jgi:hypothetical protein
MDQTKDIAVYDDDDDEGRGLDEKRWVERLVKRGRVRPRMAAR